MVELGRGLVVPGTPACAAVDGHDCTLIVGQQDDVGIVRVDPEILIIVPTGSATEAGPGLASIG